MIQDFVFTFVPLFIVIDAFGALPFVVLLTEGAPRHQRSRMVQIAVATAAVLGLLFLFFGLFILNVMGISVGAFAIAGGIILLVLSIEYITRGRIVDASREEMVAVVPIGTPLLAGPATITTLLLLQSQYPLYWVLISFLLNLVLALVVFIFADYVVRFLGRGGIKAISKVFSLLLAAIAVNMIINGLELLGIITSTGLSTG